MQPNGLRYLLPTQNGAPLSSNAQQLFKSPGVIITNGSPATDFIYSNGGGLQNGQLSDRYGRGGGMPLGGTGIGLVGAGGVVGGGGGGGFHTIHPSPRTGPVVVHAPQQTPYNVHFPHSATMESAPNSARRLSYSVDGGGGGGTERSSRDGGSPPQHQALPHQQFLAQYQQQGYKPLQPIPLTSNQQQQFQQQQQPYPSYHSSSSQPQQQQQQQQQHVVPQYQPLPPQYPPSQQQQQQHQHQYPIPPHYNSRGEVIAYGANGTTAQSSSAAAAAASGLIVTPAAGGDLRLKVPGLSVGADGTVTIDQRLQQQIISAILLNNANNIGNINNNLLLPPPLAPPTTAFSQQQQQQYPSSAYPPAAAGGETARLHALEAHRKYLESLRHREEAENRARGWGSASGSVRDGEDKGGSTGGGGGGGRDDGSELRDMDDAPKDDDVPHIRFRTDSLQLDGLEDEDGGRIGGLMAERSSHRKELRRRRTLSRSTHKAMPKKVHKMNEMGEIVDPKGHPISETARNLQLGIKVTVEQEARAPHRQITFDDYQEGFKWQFPKEGSGSTPKHLGPSFKFKDYSPAVFCELRNAFNVDAQDYVQSICSANLRIMGTPGKSGSVFFYSHDMRFIIKSLPKREAVQLRRILPNYFQHVQKNPGTLLPRFYGLHRVRPDYGRNIRLVVMNNVFATDTEIHVRYDLKGSTQGRTASARERARGNKAVLKDMDFRNAGGKFALSRQQGEQLMAQIRADCTLLMSLNMMDYSLLLGLHHVDEHHPIHPQPDADVLLAAQTDRGILSYEGQGKPVRDVYFLGIIDILMTYTTRKKAEKVWKRMTEGHGASSKPPHKYAKRFCTFISNSMALS